MARNWEGKSIQALIDSANARSGNPRVRLTTEQIEVERKRDGLLLHRTRVMHDLENCRDERRRQTLADGLAYLETQIAALEPQK